MNTLLLELICDPISKKPPQLLAVQGDVIKVDGESFQAFAETM